MADRFFELFAVVFFLTRIVAYGYVVYDCYLEAIIIINNPIIANPTAAITSVSLLAILYVLQVCFVWFFAFCLSSVVP